MPTHCQLDFAACRFGNPQKLSGSQPATIATTGHHTCQRRMFTQNGYRMVATILWHTATLSGEPFEQTVQPLSFCDLGLLQALVRPDCSGHASRVHMHSRRHPWFDLLPHACVIKTQRLLHQHQVQVCLLCTADMHIG